MAEATVTQSLVLKNFSGVPELTETAFNLKHEALKAAKLVRQVQTEPELMHAVGVMRELRAIQNGIEHSRKAVKRPVLDLGKKIDTIAYDFIRDVDKAAAIIEGMVNHYQRKQIEAKNKQAGELERAAQSAEQWRKLANEAKEKGDLENAKRLEAKAVDAEMEADVTQPLAIAKPKGLVVRQRVTFEITNPIVFVQAYPDWWKWDPKTETLKLKRQDILEELNREDGKGLFHITRYPEELSKDAAHPELVQPAGMRVYHEVKAHVR